VIGPEEIKDAERQVQVIREHMKVAQSRMESYTNK
jgi:hypothetical protein